MVKQCTPSPLPIQRTSPFGPRLLLRQSLWSPRHVPQWVRLMLSLFQTQIWRVLARCGMSWLLPGFCRFAVGSASGSPRRRFWSGSGTDGTALRATLDPVGASPAGAALHGVPWMLPGLPWIPYVAGFVLRVSWVPDAASGLSALLVVGVDIILSFSAWSRCSGLPFYRECPHALRIKCV